MLRCRSIASLQRTVSTPPLVDFSRASHLDLFEQPANRVFQRTVRLIPRNLQNVVLVPPVPLPMKAKSDEAKNTSSPCLELTAIINLFAFQLRKRRQLVLVTTVIHDVTDCPLSRKKSIR